MSLGFATFRRPGAALFWLIFFGVILWAWWVMYSMAADMGRRPMNMHDFAPLAVMWAIMMAAMMGPTFVPTLGTYEDLIHSANGTRAGSLGVVAGYFAVWLIFAVVIAAVQVALIELRFVTRMGRSMSVVFSAGLLLAAGIYQFTSLKDRCLAYCRSPMSQFLAFWRPGLGGGFIMGLRHGAWCVTCCWGLMVIGFVGGVMDLVWMGGATLLMTLEKLEPVGRYMTRPVGVGLILWGIWLVGGIF